MTKTLPNGRQAFPAGEAPDAAVSTGINEFDGGIEQSGER
jgi:hypothetical protein